MDIDNDVGQKTQSDEQRTKSKEKPMNFFQRIFAFLFGSSDPDYKRKKLLKDLAKILRKHRFKFYKPHNEIIEPIMANFFYEFYRILGPAQSLVKYADYSGVLKTIIIESTLSADQLMIKERLMEESIRERAKQLPPKELTSQVKDDLVTFFSAFEIERVKEINHTYKLLTNFVDLIHFDYYFFLKKFDSSMPEGNFFYNPHFESLNAEYVIEDIKDFLDIIESIEDVVDWPKILDILKEYRGVDVVSRSGWKKILNRIKDLKKTKILLLIVQHVDKNPYLKAKPNIKKAKIVESYLTKLKAQIELILQKIFKEQHKSKVGELTNLIFGTASISRLKNYTEKANIAFSKKMMGGFIYVRPLNYLKAFLLDYLKKDIREIVDLLLIKGKWSTNIISQQLSESFHKLLEISDNLTEFDESLSEENDKGTRLKSYVHKSDKDKTAQKILRQMLKEVNDMAKGYIHESAQNLISIGKNIKLALEDYTSQPHELIINWKEIEMASDKKIKPMIVSIYKKIFYMVKLLQVYVKEE